MTSCYSDNQPDFAFLLPYETKTFEQRWYSLCGLEQLKNANQEAAVSVTDERVAFNVTAPHSSAAILRVTYGEMVVAEQKFENVRRSSAMPWRCSTRRTICTSRCWTKTESC